MTAQCITFIGTAGVGAHQVARRAVVTIVALITLVTSPDTLNVTRLAADVPRTTVDTRVALTRH